MGLKVKLKNELLYFFKDWSLELTYIKLFYYYLHLTKVKLWKKIATNRFPII